MMIHLSQVIHPLSFRATSLKKSDLLFECEKSFSEALKGREPDRLLNFRFVEEEPPIFLDLAARSAVSAGCPAREGHSRSHLSANIPLGLESPTAC